MHWVQSLHRSISQTVLGAINLAEPTTISLAEPAAIALAEPLVVT